MSKQPAIEYCRTRNHGTCRRCGRVQTTFKLVHQPLTLIQNSDPKLVPKLRLGTHFREAPLRRRAMRSILPHTESIDCEGPAELAG